MNSLTALLETLDRQGVKLWAEQGQLRCRAAKGVLTIALREQLAEHKAALLQLLDRGEIETAKRDGEVPLSFSQQRLWFLEQLEGQSAVYNMPFALRLDGPLDGQALEQAINGVVQRHESLRTTFPDHGGEPRQQVAPSLTLPLPLSDLSGLEQEEQAIAVRCLGEQESQTPFDLCRGPLLRVRLLRCCSDHHVLLLTMHHIVADGWSVGVLVRELGALYRAFATGESSPLHELPLQYSDFAIWQRQRFATGRMADQIEFWKQTLTSIPQLLQLPLDYPRPPIQTFNGAVVRFRLGERFSNGLRQFSRERGVTLFMTLLAGFSLLLHRLSGQEDLVIGSPIANRNRGELEGLIGLFVNTLALRIDCAGDPTFNELLARVAQTAQNGYANQDLPFEHLVEILQPERSLSHSPIFQVMMILQNTPEEALALGGLSIRQLELARVTAKFDITLTFAEDRKGLAGELEYNSDLFAAESMERLANRLHRLLDQAVADPELPISRFALLTEEEQEALCRWNATTAEYPSEACLHELIAEQAARTPDRIAVVCGKGSLTYEGLQREAGHLSARLRRFGIGPGKVVGVCLERDQRLLTALIAVLAAGGAYLPLDPDFPAERLSSMLADSGTAVLLSHSALARRLPPGKWRPLYLDGEGDEENTPAPAAKAAKAGARDLAYLIYTSGSTGRPKGVAVEHRSLVNFLHAMARTPGFSPDDRLLSVTTVSFDIAALELFLPLIRGGRVIIADRETAGDGNRLQQLLHQSGATVMQATPATWRMLQVSGWRPAPPLRILCGGEALGSDLAAYLRSGGSEAWNLYGPTETTIWSAAYRLDDRRDPCHNSIEPIGRPIANTTLHVLDAHLQPVPEGVTGDLYIGGIGVARGYHNRPELTADRFIPDPFSDVPGARLYQTGDLARIARDGLLEFVGRSDQQIKLRGFRIEPGEIESTLLTLPEVEEALVTLHRDRAGEQRLTAYLVPAAGIAEGNPTRTNRQLKHWQEVWDAAYGEKGSEDPSFDLSGWNSSYTGLPIPAEEMREWLDRCVARIEALQPRRLLEIGVGTGLLLTRLAPRCQRYLACDFSPAALQRIERLRQKNTSLAHVELRQCAAHQLADLPAGCFDTLVLNSVVQYFPGLDYLQKVLTGCIRLMCPGGAIFLGDLRDYTRMEEFHASVQNARGGPTVAAAQIKRRIADAMSGEEELLIAPAFFTGLAEQWPALTGVEILGKEGRYANELNRFRYDVVLRVTASPGTSAAACPEEVAEHLANRPMQARQRKQLLALARGHLTGRLPEYMLPAGYVLLDRFPLTANRKIDRAALPPPDGAGLQAGRGSRPPATPLEQTIARIWEELLDCGRVGAEDNFFSLGGHSLLAARVASRLRTALGKELGVRTIFEQPTVAGLARHLEQEASLPPAPEPVRPARRRTPLPLSFSQQRLWFLDQLLGANPSYNMPALFELRGPLDQDALQTALQGLAARHESLRTVFAATDGQPEQLVLEHIDIPLTRIDLRHLDADSQWKAMRELAQQEAETPFDLARGPLLRMLLLRPEEHCHLLLLTLHHIIADLWSIGLLLNDLALLYNSLLAGGPPQLLPLPVQYADFTLWQRHQLRGQRLQQLAGYWRQQLAAIPSCLELPTDLPRPQTPGHQAKIARFLIPPALLLQLQQVAAVQGATPFMLFLAAFGVLLGRLSGQEDLVIGTPVAGRNQPELEGLIGFFINSLPLRLDLGANPAFSDLLRQARQNALDGYAHQEFPFELMVEQLRPERNTAHTPVFQVMLSYQNVELRQPELTGLRITSLEQDVQTAKFDLTLFLTENERGVEGELKYRADLFLPATMDRWCARFLVLLQGVAEDPQRPIRDLPLETEEAQRLLASFNDPVRQPPPEDNLLTLLDQTVLSHRRRIALAWDNGECTYDELDRKVRALAGHLRAKGLGTGQLIALYMERSAEQVLAILAIIRSGNAYLPMDPQLPRERLLGMTREAGVRAVLTSAAHELDATELFGGEEAPLLVIPDIPSADQAGEVSCRATDPICVLYTSGSTGRPKGVVLTHGAVCNYLRWAGRQLPLTPQDAVLFKTPAGFDPSLWELFATLTSGSRLVIAEPDGQRRPDYLLSVIRQHRISQLRLVPTLLKMLLESGDLGDCTSLRRILCGGEVLTVELATRLHQTLAVDLFNLYGPTETCINATWCKVEPGAAKVGIGRPIDNTTVHILDAHGRPVPLCSTGEIHIGGACLSPGYRNRPDLTAERFIPHPGGEGRLYRTGDLGRFLDDGSIVFLGRNDQQVKLRGYRIELEEIEAVLEKLPEVRSAGVAVQADSSGEPALVAYLEASGLPRPEQLRQLLARNLPDYMTVSRFMLVDQLPRGSNGKLIRRHLPETEATPLVRTAEGETVLDETEALIARLMAQLLDQQHIGRDDDFFALGGHSLTATRLIARIRSQLGREVPLGWLFAAPTPAGLAAVIGQHNLPEAEPDAQPLVKRPRRGRQPAAAQS